MLYACGFFCHASTMFMLGFDEILMPLIASMTGFSAAEHTANGQAIPIGSMALSGSKIELHKRNFFFIPASHSIIATPRADYSSVSDDGIGRPNN
ncbi:hypothetical protein [Glaciimonas sp. PAMC28666]|uniref:hypothetical protein n=1 Tax=Glaciimonas sp. PAMC28666 TaxID=2807626 RepID=UPI001962DDA2|nr:hypothetical protein [Glaciimonas sp. PAMC28666]QRX81142.1 hypothetical protein JQN73_13135 [Glaciimonas sp. PAMC28666]